MNLLQFCIFSALVCFGFSIGIASNRIGARNLTEFAKQDWSGWQHKIFKGQTQYDFVNDHGKTVVAARANGTASGMLKKISVDLNKTPFLHWRWRITEMPDNRYERLKRGDDFTARIYVVKSGGLFIWRTRVLNYVWSVHQPVNQWWPNPYAANFAMLSIRSGQTQLNQWVEERRNIKQDFKQIFGLDLDRIDAVAIMTDMDNTGQSATAYYGDIYFAEN